MQEMLASCTLCPRKCHTNRNSTNGFCGAGSSVKLARAAIHMWEEPCISGKFGSGTVFFSGCSLKCCFCQNYQISAENFGKEISVERLAEIFLELQEQKAHNINLVNPTQYLPFIIEAIDLLRKDGKFNLPIVYNTSGYETIETLEKLAGYVDIFLPDLKYVDPERSKRYSNAEDYFDMASKAILFMQKMVGKPVFNSDGIMEKGVIIRHLVMPKGYEDSISVMKWITQNFDTSDILVSVMSQYTPFYHSNQYEEINRRIFSYEYHKVMDCINELSLNGFMQEKSSAKEEYTPLFNLEGV